MSGAARGAGSCKAGLNQGRGASAGPRWRVQGWDKGAGAVVRTAGRAGATPRAEHSRTQGLQRCAPFPGGITPHTHLAASQLPPPLCQPSPDPESPTAVSLPPGPTETLLCLLLQAMALGVRRVLVLLSILQMLVTPGGPDDATLEELRQHEEHQRDEIEWLLAEMEWLQKWSQQPHGGALSSWENQRLLIFCDVLSVMIWLCWIAEKIWQITSRRGASNTRAGDKAPDKVGTCFCRALPQNHFLTGRSERSWLNNSLLPGTAGEPPARHQPGTILRLLLHAVTRRTEPAPCSLLPLRAGTLPCSVNTPCK